MGFSTSALTIKQCLTSNSQQKDQSHCLKLCKTKATPNRREDAIILAMNLQFPVFLRFLSWRTSLHAVTVDATIILVHEPSFYLTDLLITQSRNCKIRTSQNKNYLLPYI